MFKNNYCVSIRFIVDVKGRKEMIASTVSHKPSPLCVGGSSPLTVNAHKQKQGKNIQCGPHIYPHWPSISLHAAQLSSLDLHSCSSLFEFIIFSSLRLS